MFPEGGDESSASLGALEPGASDGAKFVEISGTEVRQLMLFPMSPEVLHGIELGRIGRQEFQLDVAALGFDPVADQTAAMGLQPVPDDQQFAPGEMLAEAFEESDNLGCADGTFDQLEVDVPERDTCHRRELVPGEAVLQDRRLASGCPGSDAMRPFADPGFVYEDDDPALPGAVFLVPASAWSSNTEWRPHRAGWRDHSAAGRRSSAP